MLTRRSILASVPAVAAVVAMPAVADGDEALLELEREYLRRCDSCTSKAKDLTDEELDHVVDRANDIADAIWP